MKEVGTAKIRKFIKFHSTQHLRKFKKGNPLLSGGRRRRAEPSGSFRETG